MERYLAVMGLSSSWVVTVLSVVQDGLDESI